MVTVVRVEAGKEPPPRDLTLFALDRALLWVYGSAERVLHGGDPEEIPPEFAPRHVDDPGPVIVPLGEPTVTEENSRPAPEVDRLPVGRGREAGEVLRPDDFTPEQWRDLRRYAEFIKSQNPEAQ